MLRKAFIAVLMVFPMFAALGQDTGQDLIDKKRKKFVTAQDRPARPETETKDPDIDPRQWVYAQVIDGDTMPVRFLPTVYVVEKRQFKSKRAEKKYYRLRRHVKKVYPYAKLAGAKLREYNDTLLTMEKKERKRFMKLIEQELKDEFGDELSKLTRTQGRILIKLIDRETGNTSYELVKDLRGAFSAFFWQSLARLFGHNLKSIYDPKTNAEDAMIEELVELIEAGQI